MKNITKLFPGVKALSDVNLSVRRGEIHALVGENGAGKSTLMKILSGVYPYGDYLGDIFFNGQKCRFKGIRDSEKTGIAIIYQELALSPFLTIAENIYLRHERSSKGIIDWERTHRDAAEILKKVGLREDTHEIIKNLSIGKQQLVEIAKALSKEIKLLVLDEPTASLNENDSQNLMNLVLELKKEGITSILITHKLTEVIKVADRITILRDGSTIETLDRAAADITEDRIICGMVGRAMENRYPHRESIIGDVFFQVCNWNVDNPTIEGKKSITDVTFSVCRGEIVGFAGLMGAGRTELALSIFGKLYGENITGKIFKNGRQITMNSVQEAITHKVAYVTEDRKGAGLNAIESIKNNITIAGLKKLQKRNVISQIQEEEVARTYCRRLEIKTSDIFQQVDNLSGGNQQKVVLSKWIFTEPELLILDEPTRGIDVGAKYEIFTIINQLADEGKSIIFISSDMPELLGMCDRIYVINEGKIVGELTDGDMSQEKIMQCILRS
jgi:putative multiple sugar transport system ATP-binding protein